MASSRVRRRRREERRARSASTALRHSYRQNSYRAVQPLGTVKRAVRLRTRVSGAKRISGAVGWNDIHRQVDRLRRWARKRSSSARTQRAVRSISLVERIQRVQRRGIGGPCIRRPNSRLAGEARQRASGSGPKRTRDERLSRFRVWC